MRLRSRRKWHGRWPMFIGTFSKPARPRSSVRSAGSRKSRLRIGVCRAGCCGTRCPRLSDSDSMKIPGGRRCLQDGDLFHARGLHMDDVIDVLQRTFEEKELSLNDSGAESVENVWRDDDVGDPGFIFKA